MRLLKDSVNITILGLWSSRLSLLMMRTSRLTTACSSSWMMSTSTSDGSKELKHTLCMLRKHLLQADRHRVCPEEIMVESSIRVNPDSRVKSQELVQQIHSPLVLHIRLQSLLHPPLLYLWYLHLAVKIQQLHSWPDVWLDGPTQLGYQCELMLLGVALHDRRPGPHLCHDAASPPHVYRRTIVPFS